MGIIHIEPLLEHGEDAILFELPMQPLDHLLLPVRLVVQLRQLLSLRVLQKFPKQFLIDRKFRDEVRRIPSPIPLVRKRPLSLFRSLCVSDPLPVQHLAGQVTFDTGFEGFF